MSGIKSSLFGKEGSPSQSGYNAFPGYAQTALEGAFNTYAPAVQQAKQFVPYTQQGLSAINNLSNQGQIGGNFNFGQQGNAAYGQARDTLGSAGQYFQNGAQNPTGQDIQGAISNYYNPFESQVIGGLNNDYTQGLAQGQNALSSRLGSAFGGDRAALGLSSFSNQALNDYTQNVANTRSAGYQNAAQLGSQQLENNRNAQFNAGNGLTSLGGQQAGLGNDFLNARQTMQNIAGQQQGQATTLNNNLLQADALQRNPTIQNNQIPLQQIQQLLSLFAPLQGTSTGAQAATNGLFSSGGNGIAGAAKAASLFL